jgi:hypothetical protein
MPRRQPPGHANGGRPHSRALARVVPVRGAIATTDDEPAARLAHLLESPDLAGLVPRLPAASLHELIRACGLEACTALVAAATPVQLQAVLDADLWPALRPGLDASFDGGRFGEWVEALVATSESDAARIVAALDHAVVVSGLSSHVRVLDVAVLSAPATDDAPPAVEASDRSCEIGGYLVVARRRDAWDAIVALLRALGDDHAECFHALMCGCRRLSDTGRELDGLDDLLAAPEQWLDDAARDRDERRAEQGFATAADARAFLALARQRGREHQHGPLPPNPIAAACLRAADEAAGAGPDDAQEQAPLRHARELAFLANTLVAGCAIQGRTFTPRDASAAALATCRLGLELWPSRQTDGPDTSATALVGPDLSHPLDLFDHRDLITAFEIGWSCLHDQVCLFTADRLLAVLAHLRCLDAETQIGLRALQRTLAAARVADAPWRARDALDVVATLDLPAWVSLCALLDECPVIAATLTASLERRTGAVSATDITFIATRAQLGLVRAFMTRLPEFLA